ncbi:hypothetical protein B0H14DRAFT_2852860 [Mycena olivaceomarginata]|nr:hypothetical protein B0H14DRAFT_2852860 [Mycena olivaceomarginata]
MTISQDSFAPLVAVVWCHRKSRWQRRDWPGGIRQALPRPSIHTGRFQACCSSSAKRGVEVVVVSLVLENKEEVYKAFSGADSAFLVTNYWDHGDKERETNEGSSLLMPRNPVGCPASSGPVFRPTPSSVKGSSCTLTTLTQRLSSPSMVASPVVPFVDLQAGFYDTLFFLLPVLLQKQQDGRFAIPMPVTSTLKMPMLDVARDYGLWARYLLELPTFPDGSSIVAHSDYLSVQDLTQQLAKATGKEIVFTEISMEQFKQNLQAAGIPPNVEENFVDVWLGLADFGWPITTTTEVLPRPTRTWAEFAEITDWSKALV